MSAVCAFCHQYRPKNAFNHNEMLDNMISNAEARHIVDIVDTWEEMACLWFPPEDISNEFRDEGVVEKALLLLLIRYLS